MLSCNTKESDTTFKQDGPLVTQNYKYNFNSLSSKQFTSILNAITKISKNKKSFIITLPNNSVKALYPNLKIAYTDNNTLEKLIQFNIGIIAISEGRLIGKWQQYALHTQKTPQTLAELIP